MSNLPIEELVILRDMIGETTLDNNEKERALKKI